MNLKKESTNSWSKNQITAENISPATTHQTVTMTGKVMLVFSVAQWKSRRTQAGHRPTQFTRCNLARCRKARSKVDLDGCCSSFISSCLEALSFRARPTHHTPIRRLSYNTFLSLNAITHLNHCHITSTHTHTHNHLTALCPGLPVSER